MSEHPVPPQVKVKSVTVSYGMTINTGNYENEKIEVSLEADLTSGITVDQAFERLESWCREKCRRAYLRAKDRGSRGY